MTTKVLFLGDTHGDLMFLSMACQRAVDTGCGLIVQLGDWGFLWPRSDKTKSAEKLVKDAGLRLVFIDGNHDWHEQLEERYDCIGGWADVSGRDPGIYYCERGHYFTWGEVSFVGMGGAPSINRPWRKIGKSWFATEEISEGDVSKALDGAIEPWVLVTHDAPQCPAELGPIEDGPWRACKDWFQPLADQSTSRVRMVARELNPLVHFHGHYHVRYTLGNLEGLNCNGSSGGIAVATFWEDDNGGRHYAVDG